MNPTAALVIIGAEVLSGKVDDANSPFLIRALRELGIEVCEIRTVGDTIDAIAAAVKALVGQVTYVFTSGGIGPTHDDVTIDGIAAGLGLPVVVDAAFAAQIREKYGSAVNPARLRLANMPEGGRIRFTARHCPFVEVANVVVFPGVPMLLQECFKTKAPELTPGSEFYGRALFLDVTEGVIAQILSDVQHAFAHIAIGSYPRFDAGAGYRVKVTIDGRDGDAVAQALAALRQRLQSEWIIREE